MSTSYTILSAVPRRRRLFAACSSDKANWLAAVGTLAVGVPLALGFSFFLFANSDDDAAAMSGELSPAQIAQLALPDLPEAGASTQTADNAANKDDDGDEATAPEQVAAANQGAAPAAPQDNADVQTSTTAQVEVPPEDPSHRVMRMEWGDTLIGLLAKAAVPDAEAHEAVSALRTVFNPTQVQAGENVTVVFDDSGKFTGFEFEPTADRAVRVERHGDSYKAASVLRPLSDNVMAAAVAIDDSLYQSGIKAGVPVGVMADLVKALSYSVDFQRDIQQGDSFRVMYQVKRNPEGVLVRAGDVLFAEVNLGDRVVPVYRFGDQYYDSKGHSMRRSLLRTPVNAVRITSGFGMRHHPLLGYSRMHRGVDFGAPTGTNIYASGDGVIIERGWKNGYGNYIRIRHSNTVSTAYGHMSRFASGLQRGSRVKQGQVIGYVGSTGRSTGPHLHYEVMVNGTQVNPLRVTNLGTQDSLTGRDLTAFRRMVEAISVQFKSVKSGQAIDVAFNSANPVQAKRINN